MQIEPNDLWLFAKIADAGSFSKAGELLGLPKSTLSRRISNLEKQLGERLLQRTTRQLNLTEFGLRLLQHGRQVSEEIEAAMALAQHRQIQPSGVLRISMPNDFANLFLAPLLAEFSNSYPAITLEIDLSARRVDLLSESFDLAIRMGDLPDDATLTAKRLNLQTWGLYASHAYLHKRGTPEHPEELLEHDALSLLAGNREAPVWRLSRGEQEWLGMPPIRIQANSPELLVKLAMQDQGIVAAPDSYASTYMPNQELVRVLPEWCLPQTTAWLVFPGRRLMPTKTRVFIDFLETHLKDFA
ncbi:LysR family transcriptional regulator [Methylomonas sp. EFPC1]|uniref:LysR family transcriptional regulator n=1 Tax=Methylomonas sp. EFPC1 TaxID=2812647 RepID=UPI001966EBE2|nr:LysR family transcriptional regulator [Methylomonas sp. EFPC1]QSB00511.1 LysR family transcriptional regulator [Methylomonas sp. EFPC1]